MGLIPQQATSLLVVMPQIWLTPLVSVRNARPPSTSLGTDWSVVFPMPSSPKLLSPQQYATPAASAPQVLVTPAVTETRLWPPDTWVGVVTLGNVLPFPSWPDWLPPQQ